MPRSRRYGEYAPLRPGQSRRPPWLRTAQLNSVGWSAVLGVCAAAGCVGVLLARALGLSGSSGLVLTLVPVGAVVLADRRRWAGMETAHGWGGSVEEVTQVVEELRYHGVAAKVRPDVRYEQPWWDRIDSPSEPRDEPTASLVYTNRHEATVRIVLRAHGINLPDRW
ncbi:MAG TPA: hypothetical protein VFG98_01565 [Intrasporangium sp.]|nr:hypothetical protein [Intrasporangium sp.]